MQNKQIKLNGKWLGILLKLLQSLISNLGIFHKDMQNVTRRQVQWPSIFYSSLLLMYLTSSLFNTSSWLSGLNICGLVDIRTVSKINLYSCVHAVWHHNVYFSAVLINFLFLALLTISPPWECNNFLLKLTTTTTNKN